MQKITGLWYLLIFLAVGCIGDDVVKDRVSEKFMISNPIQAITLGDTYTLEGLYTDQVGKIIDISSIQWESSDPSIASIDAQGTLEGISIGEVTISAGITQSEMGTPLSDSLSLSVVSVQIDNSAAQDKSGTLNGSYGLKGGFILKEIPNSPDLELILEEDFQISPSTPGPYLYLTNNGSSIQNALEIGMVQKTDGPQTYRIPNSQITQYSILLIWCKPFGVKIGSGNIL